MGTRIRGIFIGSWMGKVPTWECLFVHQKKNKDYSYRYAWMTKNGLKEATCGSHVEEMDEAG